METQALDDLTGDSDEATYRERAAAKLAQIARDAKDALADHGIADIDLFFMAPNSGDSVLIFGTAGDPDDAAWERAGEIVSAIVRQAVGLDRVRCREVQCATTHDQDLA